MQSRSHQVLLFFGFVAFITGYAGCIPDNSIDAGADGRSDTGTDSAPTRIPNGLTVNAWRKFREISPKDGIAPPTDPTNQYSDDPAAVKLGHYLFYEKELSPDNDVSCASCHQPKYGFADNSPLPVDGAQGKEARPPRHTPSLLNVAYSKWFFWDGRRDSLWSQAILPYESPVESAGSRLELAHYIYNHDEVKQAYENIFGTLPDLSNTERFPEQGRPIPQDKQNPQHQKWASMIQEDQETINRILVNVMKSIAAFEMKLVSVNAPFDEYVDQIRKYREAPEKRDAIGEDAKKGAKIFVGRAGCAACHHGPMLMDHEFHTAGLDHRPWLPEEDLGRYDAIPKVRETKFNAAGPFSDAPEDSAVVTRLESEGRSDRLRGAFKTPPLRNLTKTAPYMHAGHYEDLQKVMEFYNDPPDEVPTGTRAAKIRELLLEENHIEQIIAFLESLEGEPVPKQYKSQPDSPLLE